MLDHEKNQLQMSFGDEMDSNLEMVVEYENE